MWKNTNALGIVMHMGHHYCTDNSSYTIKDSEVLFLQVNCSYIRHMHITWILMFDNLCNKYQPLNLAIFCLQLLHVEFPISLDK